MARNSGSPAVQIDSNLQNIFNKIRDELLTPKGVVFELQNYCLEYGFQKLDNIQINVNGDYKLFLVAVPEVMKAQDHENFMTLWYKFKEEQRAQTVYPSVNMAPPRQVVLRSQLNQNGLLHNDFVRQRLTFFSVNPDVDCVPGSEEVEHDATAASVVPVCEASNLGLSRLWFDDDNTSYDSVPDHLPDHLPDHRSLHEDTCGVVPQSFF